MPAHRLDIRLFGPLQIRIDGTLTPAIRSRKAQWLLAVLALRAGCEVNRDWLAALLWAEHEHSKGRRSLRQCLCDDLRPLLGAASLCLRAPTQTSLRLDKENLFVDVAAFDAAIAKGDVASLAEAVALYRGALLEGCNEEWVLEERRTREQAYLQALESLASHASAEGDPARAAGCLQRVVAADALREGAHRGLMQAMASAGDYAAASRVYHDLRQLLHREMNASPSPETDALYTRLKQEASQPIILPLQPPRDVTLPPRRLPSPLTRLIGREQEVEDVVGWLGVERLVTLTGAGGVGKTRLAIAVAEAVWEGHPDGAWFVDLAALSDPALIPQAVATVLGMREEAGRALLQILIDALASRSLLLVLDNCEHLLDACAHLAATLLHACPNVKILATSRQALGLSGESVYRVPSLCQPDPGALRLTDKGSVGELGDYEAVRLFVERARSKRSDFRLTRQNGGAVAEVCDRLDGIPLAIELAAARVGSLTVEQIASRLDDRFHLLTGGSRTALPRQQTLRATLDWSYALLSEPERALLGRLSVFVGGWTLEAAEQVCGDSVLDRLASLVDKSLVVFSEGDEGEGRYRLLETIRHYGQERLAGSGEEAGIRNRHCEHFLSLAETAEPHLQGAEQADWMDWLDREHGNLRSALVWCRTCKDQAKRSKEEEEKTHPSPFSEAALRLCGALWRFWWVRGYPEGRTYVAEALGREEAAGRTQARAKVLNGAGTLAWNQGNYEAATALYEESLAIERELEDKPGISASLYGLGNIARTRGDFEAAKSLFEQNLAIKRDLQNPQGITEALISLAAVTVSRGEYDVARDMLEESLAITRRIGDKWGIAASLHCLGWVAYEIGDYAAAKALQEQSLALSRELGNKRAIVYALNHLGNALSELGDYETARALQEQCLALRSDLGDKRGIVYSLHSLGDLAYRQGGYRKARELYEWSVAIEWELGDKQSIAHSLAAFARLASAELHPERAMRLWGAEEVLRQTIGYPLRPNEQEEYGRNVAAVREALGKETFESAWAEGRAMTLEQAIEYARSND